MKGHTMDCVPFVASLIAARHDADQARTLIRETFDSTTDPEFTTSVISLLMDLVHSAGHNSVKIEIMLELFAHVPTHVGDIDDNMSLVRADDIEDEDDITTLFDSFTEGTDRADRVWVLNPPNPDQPLPVIVLEGSGFAPRKLAVLGGEPGYADNLRDRLAARDGR